MNKFDELALITRCVLADDRQAFGQLVDAYQVPLRRFLLNLTLGDTALSDDLAQETFIKAYMGIRSFKGIAGFSTWLYRIAYNEFYSYVRKRRELSLDQHSAADAPDEGDSNALEAALTVSEALRHLSEQERTAVTLFYIEDRPVKQVATIMQLPEGTVKSHLHRAKQHLARFLRDN
ncbi:MAG: sigma-70 family RNA polymerase sigma factor [Muribaculaceae bacterium]|nr:sigma-70 family RNA polymerase sigma factor [Muribaculaceae bacterium]